jgi:hypothetical protein
MTVEIIFTGTINNNADLVSSAKRSFEEKIKHIACPNRHIVRDVMANFDFDTDKKKFKINPAPINGCCPDFMNEISKLELLIN